MASERRGLADVLVRVAKAETTPRASDPDMETASGTHPMLIFITHASFGADLRLSTMRLTRLISEVSGAGYRSSAMVSAEAFVPSAFW
jgi:hypothetical protein